MADIWQKVKDYVRKIFAQLKEHKLLHFPLRYVAIVVFALVMAGFIASNMHTSADDTPIVIKVHPGMQTAQIAELLKDKDIISHDWIFRMVAQFRGLDKELKDGEYILHRGMNSNAVMDELLKGPQNAVVKVTIPEGYTVEQIADLLAQKKVTSRTDFLALARTYAPYTYMDSDDKNVKYKLEGYLFPDTYEFIRGSSARKIIDVMTGEFNDKMNTTLRERAKEMNLSMHEVTVLASLVEAEAKFDDDRPLIAQVFFNRLKINMPLQSDTTIQYAMRERKEDLSIKDTKIDSPYNTYIHYGLPPNAVDNPGMASIKAVLYPDSNNYLYFVADSAGHNHYNETYDAHMATVNSLK